MPHQRITLSQVPHAQGQHRHREGRQPFWQRRNRQRDRGACHLQQPVASKHSNPKHRGANRSASPDQLVTEDSKLALRWGFRRLRLAHQLVDTSELRPCSGGHHHGEPAAARDDGSAVDHVDSVGQWSIVSGERRGLLRDRNALAGQSRFIDIESFGLQYASIGDDPRAAGKHQQIAGHRVLRFGVERLPVANDSRLGRNDLG